uniref:Brain tumor protein n=1 Tax=Magallana gigas TaxID=29159 RepID=K1PSV4_MAGGI
MQRDLVELEQSLFPIYREIASDIKAKKYDLHRNSRELTTFIDKQGEGLHREIDEIIAIWKEKLVETDSNYQACLGKQEAEITRTISEITQNVADLKKILDSNDVPLLLRYTSKNAEFKELPPKITVTLPKFTPREINSERIIELFGSLSALSFTTVAVEHSYNNLTQEIKTSFPENLDIEIPNAVTVINTGYENIYSVSCWNDRELWTCGDDKIMKLFNLRGELVKSIPTNSGNKPSDIAVTRSGDLVYTDFKDRTVNIVKNEQIQLIRLRDWRPRGVCSTSSGDLLVITISDDDEQTKVVRYSGSTVLQNIQFDNKGQPLYSSGRYIKYITENRNSDICVADNGVRALVVVNQAGKFRFAYTGLPSTTKVFYPRCITTDSQGRILTADKHLRIHILDQDGQLLRLIEYLDLHDPRCLCVDSKDNLYVTECRTGEVKRIQNYM